VVAGADPGLPVFGSWGEFAVQHVSVWKAAQYVARSEKPLVCA
jgi:hypothetical protein